MRKSVLGFLIGLLLVFAASAFGQARDTASIYGTVTDPQGAVVPEATVTLTSAATGQVRTIATDSTGGFVFSLLPVGTYDVAAELTGFQRYEQTGILIHANENVRVDVALQVGSVQETISVAALGTQVESRAITLKETVDQRRIVQLPLNGRNPADLALLTPGIVSGTGNNTGDSPEAGRRPRGTKQLTANGSRNNNIAYTLDGGDNQDNLSNYNLPFPFPDAVQEFSVQTATGGVDQGNSSAGAINIVTKSGTNEVHGNAFWFVRNTSLNANNFFSHQEDQLKRNQAGATIGGPLVKNKLFGFFGYQRSWFRRAAGDTRAQSMTAAERAGDFSGATVAIFDPLSSASRNDRSLFPNSQIPPSRFSPAAVGFLGVSPLPDPDGFTRFSFSTPEDNSQYIGRVDAVISNSHTLLFRYFEDNQDILPVGYDPSNINTTRPQSFQDTRNATLGHNWMVRPTLMAHSQISAMHLSTGRTSAFEGDYTDFGIDLVPNGTHIDVRTNQTGLRFRTPWGGKFGRANQQIIHDWTWNKGSHTISFGTQMAWRQYNEGINWRASGAFRFDGNATGRGDEVGFDRADFLLGQISFFVQNNGELENRRQFTKGFFISDTWRIRPRFTLTLGMRYEPYAYFWDELDRVQTFDYASWQQGTRTRLFDNAPPGLFYPGDARPGGGTFGRSLMDSDNNNLAPRIGLAWDPFGDGKTSFRTAYGIYYDAPPMWGQNNYNLVAPFSYNAQFNDGPFDAPYRGREDQNRFPVTQFTADTPYGDPLDTLVADNKYVTAYTQSWHFTMEREVVRDTLVRIGYVGTKSTSLLGEFDQNAPIYNRNLSLAENRATVDERRPIPGFQRIVRMMFGLNSLYNALQASVNKRYSNGFTILSSYTWSKTLDYHSSNGFGSGHQVSNPFDFFALRGLANQDRPHRLVNSFVWDIPSAKSAPAAVKAITSNWRIGSILSLQSGRPFDVRSAGDPVARAGRARADVSAGGNPVLDTGRSKGAIIARYFDTSRFANAVPGTYGTLGRNSLRGPGYANVDFSLMKTWPMPWGEAGRGEFRFEAFNLFNRTNLALPNTSITNVNFGTITSTDGDPRILQFGLKFFF